MDKPNKSPANLLDAIEQYAAAVEQDVRSKLRFTSYAARDAGKRKRREKQKAMRATLQAALTAAQQQQCLCKCEQDRVDKQLYYESAGIA